MKIRNKKTGEIIDIYKGQVIIHYDSGRKTIKFKSIEELEDWEDYEEPEVIYYISWDGVILHSADKTGWQNAKQIGNYFETKEEAEKAVEKLKAWKRLKEARFKFTGYKDNTNPKGNSYQIIIEAIFDGASFDDLDLLFGGEE